MTNNRKLRRRRGRRPANPGGMLHTQLKPCPFCGCGNVCFYNWLQDGYEGIRVECFHCKAQINVPLEHDACETRLQAKHRALELWNTRQTPADHDDWTDAACEAADHNRRILKATAARNRLRNDNTTDNTKDRERLPETIIYPITTPL